MKIKWRCKHCGDVLVSDSSVTHQMDVCKCGKSGLDIEDEYGRVFGWYEYIGEVEI